MHKVVCGALGALALTAWAFPVHAQATEPELELALMPRTMDVTLLNEGGKYVLADLKHIPQGGTCRMDEGATLMRVGTGRKPRDNACTLCCVSGQLRRMPVYDDV